MKNELVLYQSDDMAERMEVRLDDETVWLTQQQIVNLFDSSKANISEHIKYIFESGELEEAATVRKFRTVQKEGRRSVSRELQYYSLDVIISVGYRVNSKRGTQFRIWANQVLKEYLLKGYAVNNRMDALESNMHDLVTRLNKVELQIHANLPPTQGIFFNGQVFDAYVFAADLIKKAKSSIILLDNYVDESVLTLLSKRKPGVAATIYTKSISKQLQLDVDKHNSQYPAIQIIPFADAHDRFLILDEKELYHLGASLKDLGKRWFAFSKLEMPVRDLLRKLPG
ncbi:MAG: RhuM family protein [Sphingobacteriaceae bacterium]|nr:RhuM family protein [Sphingobacteriaceae bacterium]